MKLLNTENGKFGLIPTRITCTNSLALPKRKPMHTVCPHCKHLITEQPHICPTIADLEKHKELICLACEAEELFTLEELDLIANIFAEEILGKQ